MHYAPKMTEKETVEKAAEAIRLTPKKRVTAYRKTRAAADGDGSDMTVTHEITNSWRSRGPGQSSPPRRRSPVQVESMTDLPTSLARAQPVNRLDFRMQSPSARVLSLGLSYCDSNFRFTSAMDNFRAPMLSQKIMLATV
jgi:hypothetical protein